MLSDQAIGALAELLEERRGVARRLRLDPSEFAARDSVNEARSLVESAVRELDSIDERIVALVTRAR